HTRFSRDWSSDVCSSDLDFDRRREIIADLDSFDPAFWRALAELGVTGLIVPERDGGFGGTLGDLVPVMAALGEHLVIEPVLWNRSEERRVGEGCGSVGWA